MRGRALLRGPGEAVSGAAVGAPGHPDLPPHLPPAPEPGSGPTAPGGRRAREAGAGRGRLQLGREWPGGAVERGAERDAGSGRTLRDGTEQGEQGLEGSRGVEGGGRPEKGEDRGQGSGTPVPRAPRTEGSTPLRAVWMPSAGDPLNSVTSAQRGIKMAEGQDAGPASSDRRIHEPSTAWGADLTGCLPFPEVQEREALPPLGTFLLPRPVGSGSGRQLRGRELGG
ncbi:collagen alpha-1(I) chain-like [Phacochoerus africanus]|uniref:collagen alpha-1(I) chain-like n=1 Tax=Phacochoerus africanus TaxID=41426 RepID=UPI001FD98235|nr:collagen alpha-1(I) chain-like [Phacochoerus africanus]